MYLYLYDSFLNQKKHATVLARIETRLTDLGIGGKIFRLSPLRDTDELLKEEIRNGVKTVIVVGNDKSLTQIINLAAKFNITIGIIPVGPDNKIAQLLGVGSTLAACDIIAARIIEKVDLGKANETYFISNITVANNQGGVTIECEDRYKIIPHRQNQISICNLKPIFASLPGKTSYFNPQDGSLEILIQPLVSGLFSIFKKAVSLNNSIIPFKKIAIKGKSSTTIYTDGQRVLKPPVNIEIIPKKLKIIVGKNRHF
ncbi:MAG: diacylglycerol kinase family protein [Patescibacteria group bacterium]|jgi:diacylglycerol kinase family enzyme|nr:diacylglycerol kinase family protein [Patescibacteria group bacterium]